jgi:type II secretory pathway pseudopilin PulG
MKRCPTCNRTYTDPTLSFCIEDGTPLIPVSSADESTVVSPREAAPYQPPGTYVPQGGPARKRRVWPWVLGIGGAFILGIIVISIAAAILIPRLIRSSREQAERTANESRNSNANESANTNVNEQANANVSVPTNVNANLNANANTNTNENVNANESAEVPPPTDQEQVLDQLRDLENDWTVANINADKKALDRILADDYVGQSSEGKLQSKAEYIRTIQRDTGIEKWKFDDLKVMLAGDRATLTGNITLLAQDGEVVFDFKDKFVWRDGRWQATGSEVKRKEG